MTDLQIVTLALTLLGIFAGSWFNSSRIGDLNKRVDDTRHVLRAEAKTMQAEMNLQFERMNNKIDSQFERMNSKIDALLKSLADVEARVAALESRR